MSNVLSLRIPKSLHEEVKELAHDEGVSLNQFNDIVGRQP